jgi:hypothetical protein
VVDFVAVSLISYYGYANSFSDGPCRHPNSEWLQRRFLSPPELCRSLSQARYTQFLVSLVDFLFFLYNNTSYHTVFVAAAPLSSLRSFALSLHLNHPFVMARLLTRAQHRAARGAISRPVRPAARRARSVSSSPPRPAARRARQVSSAPAMALGAHKSTPSSGRKAESAPARASGRKAKPAVARAAPCKFLERRLCLRCAKYAETEPEHRCLFDKDSSIMCARCRALKSPCNPVSKLLFSGFRTDMV